PRDVGRIAADDPEDLGRRPVLGGGPLLEDSAARGASQALPETAPADLGGRAAADHISARRRAGHWGDGAERRVAVLPRPARQAVQGAVPPREAGGEVRQR